MKPRIIRLLLAASICCAGAVWLLAIPVPAHATGTIYTVNSTDDTVDADVGNPICSDLNGHCTLRAAIMQANFTVGADTIILPSGVYVLTRPGVDDLAVLGDLDITDNLTIQGAGSGTTIVDGNGAVTGDRVFQVFASAIETSFSGMTIQNGKKTTSFFDSGGGLYWDGGGGHLHLSDVVIAGNASGYGGGLYLNYSTLGDGVDMDHVVVRTNVATTGAAGGMAASFGDYATLAIHNSQVYGNTAYQGGGVYFQGTPASGLFSVRIENSEIYSNTASLSAGLENHSGSTAVPVLVLNSRLYDNAAGFYGGGIGNYGALVISNTTLSANSAITSSAVYSASTRGGGLYNYEGGQVSLVQSTISGNSAAFGGGIYSELFIHNGAALTATNSTLSGNIATRGGGGLYADGGQILFFNSTAATNSVQVPLGLGRSGLGGGLFITNTALVNAQNTLLGDNTRRAGTDPAVADDCFTSSATGRSLDSLGYNLIETTSSCSITGVTTGNIYGQDPNLGPLQNNGGSTQTLALLPGSPAVDAGDSGGCRDALGALLLIDQRGWHRPYGASCDIGAYERGVSLYLPLIGR